MSIGSLVVCILSIARVVKTNQNHKGFDEQQAGFQGVGDHSMYLVACCRCCAVIAGRRRVVGVLINKQQGSLWLYTG